MGLVVIAVIEGDSYGLVCLTVGCSIVPLLRFSLLIGWVLGAVVAGDSPLRFWGLSRSIPAWDCSGRVACLYSILL